MPVSNCYNIDCMLKLPEYADKQFGLGHFDTQYGIKEDGRKSASRNNGIVQKNGRVMYVKSKHTPEGWDNETMHPEYWMQAQRITDVQMIYGINYIQQNIPYASIDWGFKPPRREQYGEFIKANPKGVIIWDKVNGGSDFSDCELIWTNLDFDSYVQQFMWAGMFQGYDINNPTSQQGNKKLNQKRLHPTEKSIILNGHFIKEYAPSGKPIIDTHAGGQSMRIAAWDEGLDYEGFEINLKYFTDGEKRFYLHKQKQTLF